jgi:hypothetical protein
MRGRASSCDAAGPRLVLNRPQIGTSHHGHSHLQRSQYSIPVSRQAGQDMRERPSHVIANAGPPEDSVRRRLREVGRVAKKWLSHGLSESQDFA